MYEKPIVIENEDLAEGVFAASGARMEEAANAANNANACTFSKTSETSWGSTGQITYAVTIPSNHDTNLKFQVTFSEAVDNAWGLGGSWVLSGDKKSAEVSVYSISGQSECTIQGPTTAYISSFARIQ